MAQYDSDTEQDTTTVDRYQQWWWLFRGGSCDEWEGRGLTTDRSWRQGVDVNSLYRGELSWCVNDQGVVHQSDDRSCLHVNIRPERILYIQRSLYVNFGELRTKNQYYAMIDIDFQFMNTTNAAVFSREKW